MRIALLSGANSIHTVRWANGLHSAGHHVHVISQQPVLESFAAGIQVHLFPYRGVLGYFTMVSGVQRLLRKIKPDIVNAHYASGYGTTARLVGFGPCLLSVWGSDVYDFPYKSPAHRWLVRKNLLAADAVASTSHCMAQQTRSIAPRLGDISITPFGVDMAAYSAATPAAQAQPSRWVIGTVKTMANQYGIDILIEAFALLLKSLQHRNAMMASQLHLHLVGGGPQTAALQQLAAQLDIAERVKFVGRVPHAQVPQALAGLDIYVALSRSESFGVAIIEAGAAGRPVVVSDAGGLPEVTRHEVTGLVVPREDPRAAAAALERLLLNPDLRQRMGAAAQQHVAQNYSWPACVNTMVKVYEKTIAAYQNQSARRL